jgi:SAM-dependent methyltransferase
MTTWEQEAANWTAWARTPGHDVFPYFSPIFFEEILPADPGLTLEVGCGEGRVVRAMSERGHRAVGLDGSPTLAHNAGDLDDISAYVAGDATKLPFASNTFETVVAYNSLQTMRDEGDMAEALREAARVMKVGGRMCMCIAHPLTDFTLVGRRPGDVDTEPEASYFARMHVEDMVAKDGLTMTFTGWTYTLEDYARALAAAEFSIEVLREPQPAGGNASMDAWRRMPLFLFVRAVKNRS